MKVLYVSKALTVAAYRDKIREMQRGVRVTAVVPQRWGRDQPELSPAGVPEPARARAWLSGHNHLHVYPGAGRWIDDAAPDLVHVDEEPYSLVTLQLGRLSIQRGVPFIFFSWQNLDRRLPPLFGRVRAAVFERASGAIAGTPGAAGALVRAGFRGPVATIPQFGVDPDRFAHDGAARARTRHQLGIADDAFLIGYGGRLVVEKGVRVLVDAFARMRAGESGARAPSQLLLIGDGDDRRHLEHRADRLGVRPDVHFAGHIASTAMPALLSALDVLVLPTIGTRTWTEQFGRIMVEAMACGVPVIASRCGEIPGVIAETGTLVTPGDSAELAGVMVAYRGDVDARTAAGTAGRARVLAHFTQRAIADRTLEFYERVIHGPLVPV